jgi:acetyl-CoA carboxylase carboxyltransferase component
MVMPGLTDERCTNQRKSSKPKKGEMQFGVIYSDSGKQLFRADQKRKSFSFVQDVTGFMVGSKQQNKAN